MGDDREDLDIIKEFTNELSPHIHDLHSKINNSDRSTLLKTTLQKERVIQGININAPRRPPAPVVIPPVPPTPPVRSVEQSPPVAVQAVITPNTSTHTQLELPLISETDKNSAVLTQIMNTMDRILLVLNRIDRNISLIKDYHESTETKLGEQKTREQLTGNTNHNEQASSS